VAAYLELKSALVRALPEKLIETVTPHEWPAIVGMVEAELLFSSRQQYYLAIQQRLSEGLQSVLLLSGQSVPKLLPTLAGSA